MTSYEVNHDNYRLLFQRLSLFKDKSGLL